MYKKPIQDKEITKYKRNFYNIYHSRIAPIFSKIETERRKKLTWLVIFLIIAGITLYTIASIIFSCLFTDHFIALAFCPWFVVLGLMAGYYIITSTNSEFVKKLKLRCMPEILKVFNNMKWYDQYNLISDEELQRSQLFATYNRRSHYDSFKGTYNDVNFEIEETVMQHETGSSKNRTVVNIFRGVIIKVPANKNVKNTTIIATKTDKNIRNRNVSIWIIAIYSIADITLRFSFSLKTIAILAVIVLAIIFASKFFFSNEQEKLNEIKLEDPEFSKKYRAYSSDQVEGRYLITPAFMERFKNLQTAFGSKNAKCSFYGDNLVFAISTNKNLFEIGNLFHSIENPKQMTEFFNELSSILALIDYFKLNEKTGL